MMKEKKTFQQLSSNSVCQIYDSLLKGNFISFSLTKDGRDKVDSLVNNITGSYFGEEIYKTIEEKALAYLYFLIKDHPFVDGNKRTACLVFEVVCDLNNLNPDYTYFSLDVLAIFVEKTQKEDHHLVIKMLSGILF